LHNRLVTLGVSSAIDLVAAARRITVLTGAGVSTDSGIPDFRGPNGLWTRDPDAQRYVDLDRYRSDPAVRRESWRRRAAHPALAAEPNAAHRAIAALHEQGRLRALLTQNIDGLHQRAGVPDVLELHGSIRETECLSCGERAPMHEALARVRAGEADPHCPHCGGLLKSGTVFFGQSLDATVLERAVAATRDCDLFLAVGTSLSVQPVASLTGRAAAHGVPVVIVNASPTPYDDLAAAVVREPIGDVLPRLFDRPGRLEHVERPYGTSTSPDCRD
jgi:NAD-dependent deacetylase